MSRSSASYDQRTAAPGSRSPGWEKVADYALDWALEHAAVPSVQRTGSAGPGRSSSQGVPGEEYGHGRQDA
jgi:hypothetical protein